MSERVPVSLIILPEDRDKDGAAWGAILEVSTDPVNIAAIEIQFPSGDQRFVRDNGEDECLLRPNGRHTGIVIEPDDLECTNCGYSREYFFWYEATGFYNRLVNYCPRCGMKIFGAVTANG